MGVLADIVASKRSELDALLKSVPKLDRRLQARVTREPPVSLRREAGQPLHLIAELKFRSPSAGPLSTALDVEGRALAYTQAGAAMMSVLCDGPYFGGDYSHLERARQVTALPLLCKEFIVDEVQLLHAAAFGADWALLIVRCLQPGQLKALIRRSVQLDLVPLVEVHTADECQLAIDAGASVIGVNARDLDTLQMYPERAASILSSLPPEVTALHLSGIRSAADVATLAQSKISGALIGEVLMRQDDPTDLLKAMVNAANRAE